MKFIKAHKALWVILGLIILMLIVGLVIFIKLSPDAGKDSYGNRLAGIENYPISEEKIKTMQTEAEQIEGIQTLSYILNGRRIDLIVKVDAELSKERAIEYANKTLEYFSDEEKAYYDFQIFFKTEGESEVYPIIGYKHKTSGTYVWKQE